MNSTIAGRDGSAAGDPRIEYRLCRCSAGREFLDRLGRQRLAAYAPLSLPSPIFLLAGFDAEREHYLEAFRRAGLD